jgi:hypothetical protein
MAKVFDKKVPAIRITAHFSEFDGNLDKWEDSFYQVWRYQLTWDFAYGIKLNESRQHGVYIDLLIRPSYREPLLETMESLGYRDIAQNTEFVGIVEVYEHKELEDIEEVILEY